MSWFATEEMTFDKSDERGHVLPTAMGSCFSLYPLNMVVEPTHLLASMAPLSSSGIEPCYQFWRHRRTRSHKFKYLKKEQISLLNIAVHVKEYPNSYDMLQIVDFVRSIW